MHQHPLAAAATPSPHTSAWQVFWIFLRLGLTSFGGPVAHLGYFRDEFVQRRQWLTERSYADLVALCQFLPGPASSQAGMALGLMRAGMPGALAAWLGFTLPSALVLALFGLGLAGGHAVLPAGAIHGLKVVAVAVVAQAVWGMARSLCMGRARVTMMVLACCAVLLVPGVWGQVGVMLAAGGAGWWLSGRGRTVVAETAIDTPDGLQVPLRRRTGAALLAVFAALLVLLPLAMHLWPGSLLAMVDAFYRVGALVFGGGHVVLPLLQAEVVGPGWVSADAFLAGYGATQAVPGPLFTFAAFLGASMQVWPGGWLGAAVCLVAIFVPSFLLVAGALPFWEPLRRNPHAQAALAGVNAAVVGLLLAALYNPVWTSAIHSGADFGLALAAFVALMFWRVPPWAVVLACGVGGALLALGG
ncbi:chromate efflux transporter [Ramlibacter sp. H39-3-26]|uniref:chromate efflux transporter n=1 Tax=Curvibacter soli TaxID=3031331 RepID=UPI0023DBF31C|nr:chromate efflux transporter [Ramlibacter sp. H39-3-26]MDF1486570.1 chromate efflux transporter [Ramlibacter sp. H39-3-26]